MLLAKSLSCSTDLDNHVVAMGNNLDTHKTINLPSEGVQSTPLTLSNIVEEKQEIGHQKRKKNTLKSPSSIILNSKEIY